MSLVKFFDFISSGLFLENGKANYGTGQMVNHHDDPPTERPNLRQAEWSPWYPEACCGDSCHVNMPNVVGVSRRDNSVCPFPFYKAKSGFVRKRFFFQDASDSCSAKMQSRSGQHLSDAYLTHGRAKGFESLDYVANIVGVLVHGLGELEEPVIGIGSSLHPTGNGFRFDHESSGSFGEVPSTGGSKFQDGHSFLRGISGTSLRWQLGHARILDSDFFLEKSNLVLSSVEFASQPDPFDATIDREAPGVSDCTMGQGDTVNGCQFDIFGPVLGKRNTLKWALSAHNMVSETSWEEYELTVA